MRRKIVKIDPPINNISEVEICRYGGIVDLFDQDGNCLNEGCWFPFSPTEDEVIEFVTTGGIKGKIEIIGKK